MLRAFNPVLAVGPCFASDAEFRKARQALAREGMTLLSARTQDEAALMLCETAPSVVMIHLSLDDGSPLAVADFANYRRPDARVILLGGGGLMADGSLFAHVGNAHALISGDMPPTDLTALIAFHAGAASMMH